MRQIYYTEFMCLKIPSKRMIVFQRRMRITGGKKENTNSEKSWTVSKSSGSVKNDKAPTIKCYKMELRFNYLLNFLCDGLTSI